MTINCEFSPDYARGDNLGVVLVAYLNGDMDIAGAAIDIDAGNLLGVNLDSVRAQDVDISDELMGQADAVMSGGRLSPASPAVRQSIARRGKVVPVADRLEDDQVFLAALACTDEMIAEQQAALDAASE